MRPAAQTADEDEKGLMIMQTDDFLAQVRSRADLESSDDATRATRVVLGTFGTLDLKDELKDVASQLPHEIEQMLLAREESQAFSASELVASVAEELDLAEAEADQAASAVLTTLREALTVGEFLDFNAAVPGEFHRFMAEK